MNSTGNKLKVNAASEGKLNSHEQRQSGKLRMKSKQIAVCLIEWLINERANNPIRMM